MTIPLEHIQEGDWAALNRVVDTLRGLVLDTGGRSLGLRVGAGTLTWAGATILSGTLTVSHGLGRTPIAVVVTPTEGGGTYVPVLATFSYAATTFIAQAVTSDNSSPAAATTKNFVWVAIG